MFECPTTFGNEQQAWRVSSLSLVIDYGSYVITGRAGTGDDSMGFLLTIMQISNTYGGRPMLRLAQSIYVGNFLAQLMPSTPYWCGGGWRRAAPADCWGRDREGKGQGGREKDEGGRDWEREAYYPQLGVSRVHFCCILWLSCPCCLLFPSVLQFPSLFFLDISKLLFLYSYLFSPFIKQVSFFPSYFFIYLSRPLCLRLPDCYSAPCVPKFEIMVKYSCEVLVCAPVAVHVYLYSILLLLVFLRRAFIYVTFFMFLLPLYYCKWFFFIFWWWSQAGNCI